MLKFYIIGQTIRFAGPNIAADSYNYLEAEFFFEGESWEGYDKWAHFKQGETEYIIALDENDRIPASAGLNLSTGEWEVFLTGSAEDSRITTVPIIITVYESGLINAPLGALPISVAEQIAVRAQTALSMAQSVLQAAEDGEFDGEDGSSVTIHGQYFDTLEQLQETVQQPERGILYGVGTEPPLDFYGWDERTGSFKNVGAIQGAPGETGERGATFTPAVDSSGNLSWTNDGGLPNPNTVNIRGPQGVQGETGADGKGPYEFALEGGYSGTAQTLMDALIMAPQHHDRHEAGGLDPITITTGMLPAISATYTATIAASAWTGAAAPYTAAVTVNGMLAADTPIIDLVASSTYSTAEKQIEAWAAVYKAVTAANRITFYAAEKPTVELSIQAKVVRK